MRQVRELRVDGDDRKYALYWVYILSFAYWLFGSIFCTITLYYSNITTKILFGIFTAIIFLMWAYIEAVHGRALFRKERTYLRTVGTSILATNSITILLAIFKPGIAFYYGVLSQVLLSGTVFVFFAIVCWFGGIEALKHKLV